MKKLLLIAACFLSSLANAQSLFDASSQIIERIPNNVSSGTILNTLAKVDSSGTITTIATTDFNIPVYIVVGNAGTTGSAMVATSGIATCEFDTAGGTAGHFVIASTVSAGLCRDGGAVPPVGAWVIGQLLSSPTAGGLNNGAVLLSKGSSFPGFTLLGCASIGTAGTTLGPVTVSGLKIFLAIYIAGYAGADAASLQFNSSGGTAYRYRWLTSAAGGTTFAAGLLATSTDRIKIGAATTTASRNVDVIINNSSAVTEKLVMFINGVFGTTSAGTQATIDIGNGAWVSAASTTITSISIISTSNMNAGSKFCAYQAVP